MTASKVVQNSRIQILAIAIFLFSFSSVFAGEAFELEGDPGANDLRILAVLNKLSEDRVISDKKTKGFSYRYTSKWYSPLSIDVYVVGFSKREKVSLVRVEAPKKGMEKAFKNYLLNELNQQEALGIGSGAPTGESPQISEKPSRKSYLLSEGLAIVFPAASVLYNSTKSPVYGSGDTFKGMFSYILADLLLAGAGYYYAMSTIHQKSDADNLLLKHGPSGKVWEAPGGGVFLGLFFLPRVLRMIGGFQDTYTHNRLMELSVSKSF
ncbi:hypothetical protein CH373_01230 [Leptospira perolatii]|uniref:Uncharacterized protein n=1 Tax=Leptospira perolatii TaxID=2023191 RepID=A0A2M9ZRL3_9LEPT|nr:hypothetical protein [Leptospira perolatii]PJZ71169.1 hypothetical protein CH360_01230 [Leptospira perolatii]PJZ74702.1 hypothetical protein CH373_01230 [Leptospira perolatii]